jgi:Mg2+-importing ATPase
MAPNDVPKAVTVPKDGANVSPAHALLLTLATTSYFLGDVRAAVVIAVMVILAITTAFVQEHRSNEAAA